MDDYESEEEEDGYNYDEFEELHAQRALKNEQDREFNESLEKDALKAKEIQDQLQKEQDRVDRNERRLQEKSSMTPEPINGILVRVRTPDDGVQARRFLPDATTSDCKAWIKTMSDDLYTRHWTFAEAHRPCEIVQDSAMLSSIIAPGAQGITFIVVGFHVGFHPTP